MTREEMKNKISMALKDPILQQGFECICKENAELKKEIKENEDLATVAYMQGNENQKKKADKQLTYAKTIIQDLLDNTDEYARQRAEDFLKECE